MITPDEAGKFWHRGTRLGLIYTVITSVILGVTTSQDPGSSLAWLEKFSFLAALAPLAAASQAYVAGRRDMINQSNGSR